MISKNKLSFGFDYREKRIDVGIWREKTGEFKRLNVDKSSNIIVADIERSQW